MLNIICFVLLLTGSVCFIQGFTHPAPGYLRKAIRSRGPKPKGSGRVFATKVASKIEPYISIDPIKRERMERDLSTSGNLRSPEQFIAEAMGYASTLAPVGLVVLTFAPLLGWGICLAIGLIASAAIFGFLYQQEVKTLRKDMSQRKEAIERELPQFAGTIRQSLNTTRDVVVILESYRKVCGKTLQAEIDKTLNDIKTGSAERALKSFEARIGSVKVSELVRGLIGLLRGDDNRTYFDMLTAEYVKAQQEAVKQELLKRPGQLKPHIAILTACIFIMLAIALGSHMLSSIDAFF